MRCELCYAGHPLPFWITGVALAEDARRDEKAGRVGRGSSPDVRNFINSPVSRHQGGVHRLPIGQTRTPHSHYPVYAADLRYSYSIPWQRWASPSHPDRQTDSRLPVSMATLKRLKGNGNVSAAGAHSSTTKPTLLPVRVGRLRFPDHPAIRPGGDQ